MEPCGGCPPEPREGKRDPGGHPPHDSTWALLIRLGIGLPGIKDLARAKQSLEKRQRVLKMTVRAGRLLVNKQKFCSILQAKRPFNGC